MESGELTGKATKTVLYIRIIWIDAFFADSSDLKRDLLNFRTGHRLTLFQSPKTIHDRIHPETATDLLPHGPLGNSGSGCFGDLADGVVRVDVDCSNEGLVSFRNVPMLFESLSEANPPLLVIGQQSCCLAEIFHCSCRRLVEREQATSKITQRVGIIRLQFDGLFEHGASSVQISLSV